MKTNPQNSYGRCAQRPYLIIVFLFILNSQFSIFNSSAQPLVTSEYSHRRYTAQDGLPSMVMQCVFKDSKGFLWQGTLKGGTCFDGFHFQPYSLEKFPIVGRIEEINGQIRFLETQSMFYPKTERFIQIADSINLNYYNSYLLPPNYYIFENGEGYKYFVKLEKDTIAEVIDIPQLQGLYRCKVYLDLQQNFLYIPDYRNKKVYTYHLQTKEIQSIDNIVIESFIKHSRLGLLAIGNDGIYKIENRQAILVVPLKFEMQNKIAVEAKNGDLYVKDFYNIYRLSNNKLEHLYRNSFQTIWDIVLDDDDNVWLATNKGLFNFFHFDFKNLKIPNHNIRSVTQDKNGTYWFAGDNLDIFSFSAGKLKPVDFPEHPEIQTLGFNHAFSFNESVYFCIRGGVLIRQNNRFHWAELPLNQYYSNIVPYGNNLVVTGSNAIFEMTPNGKLIKTITREELKQPGVFYGLAVDKNNRLIVGGSDGISIIDNEKIRFLKNENTFDSDVICVTHQNHIFSAARKYLNLLESDSIRTIYSFDNDYIMGLMQIDHENMLISTLKGFYIFNIKNYFEKNKIQLLFYNHNNGMNGIEPAFSQLFLDKEGLVWMVTSENIITFKPQKLIRQIAAPNLIIQNFAVSKDNAKWENVTGLTNTKFSYLYKNFKFSVIGLNFSAIENVRYSYRLHGFQNEWSEPTKNREITFNNLPPGDYLFEIYADAGTEESRSEVQSFAFSIKPAFWQTAWFLSLCIVSLILASAGITLNIQRRKNKILLEKLRTEKELNELRISTIRLKSIPHFNANILAAIEYYISNRTKEDTMRILEIYSDFTYKTLSEVDKSARPIEEELAYVKMYLDLEKVRFIDKFDFNINVADEVDKSVQLPNMILHTYCENAVKHGLMSLKSGGLLTIDVSQHDNFVRVSVEDNGVGRAAAAQNKHVYSTKQGLSILNRQIEIYNRFNKEKINQHIEDLEKGTRFTVEVPVGYNFIN